MLIGLTDVSSGMSFLTGVERLTALHDHFQFSSILDHVVDDFLLISILGLFGILQARKVDSPVLQTPALLACKLRYSTFGVQKEQIFG